MLIFRRMSNRKAKCNLELRHQRTCDVVFDWMKLDTQSGFTGLIDADGMERSSNYKPVNYMYKMIETMLPKAMVQDEKKHIRLLEVWGQNNSARKGWVKLI